jgi:hypothetical protein
MPKCEALTSNQLTCTGWAYINYKEFGLDAAKKITV